MRAGSCTLRPWRFETGFKTRADLYRSKGKQEPGVAGGGIEWRGRWHIEEIVWRKSVLRWSFWAEEKEVE